MQFVSPNNSKQEGNRLIFRDDIDRAEKQGFMHFFSSKFQICVDR